VLDDLIAFLSERLPTPGSLALVLDRSGSVLATSGLTTEASTTEAVDPRILEAVVSSESELSVSTEPVLIRLESETATEGQDSIAAIAPVGALDKWSLVVIAPEAELVVTSTVSAGVMSTVLPALALAFLTALIVVAAAYVLRLRSAARTDALTGLLSRYEIVRRLTGPLSRGQSSGALAIIDLNHFKQVNDEHGHGIGDFVLRETARRIGANVPRSATVGRLGGDEFIVALSLEVNPINQLKVVIASLAEPITIGQRTINTGGSAGVTFFNEGEPIQLRQVLREADLALYAAKQDEASSVRIFNRSMEPTNDTAADRLIDLAH
jgi:diguanylate cyclase (GGDEF)-like protein